MKRFAHKRQLGFKLKDLDRLGNDMKKRIHTKKLEENNWLAQALAEKSQLAEGYYGTATTSYTDKQPKAVRLIIKHNKRLSETDQRFRNVDKIFVETESGARFPCPTNKPSEARAFARHIAEGGEYNDDRWRHIKQLSEDVGKLARFARATHNKQFGESIARVVTEAVQQYSNLRENLKKITGARGYHQYFESWTPTIMECSDDDLLGAFTNSSIDPRIEQALPVLARLNIKVGKLAESNEFESWAESIVDEAIFDPMDEDESPELRGQREEILALVGPDSEEMPVGPDAMSAIGELKHIIDDTVLYDRLRKIAESDPDTDARDSIKGWMAEQPPGSIYAEITDELKDAKPGEYAPKPTAPKRKSKPQQPAPMPPLGGAPGGGLPPPPPLAEEQLLSDLKRLIGR
jgi:hypothetical protein